MEKSPSVQTSSFDETSPPKLIAYRLEENGSPIVPASKLRDWMEEFPTRTPYKCLPILMANQSGWLLLNPVDFVVHWDGTMDKNSALKIAYLEPPQTKVAPIISHFGNGILSWLIPYVFRTSPGWNLLVRGPANHIKRGIVPFEGLVETDWSPMTFTMNWQIVEPNHLISFKKGEPFCMIVPQRRNELEQFETEVIDYQQAPDSEAMDNWTKSRGNFLAHHYGGHNQETAVELMPWQGTYFRGQTTPDTPDAPTFPEHQLKRDLKPFSEEWADQRRRQPRGK